MIKRTRIENEELTIETERGIFKRRFHNGIYKSLIFGANILVLLKLVKGDAENRNIFCLDENAEIKWQIEDPDLKLLNKTKTSSAFTEIRIKDNKLIANSWNDGIYEVDISTGKIKYIGWAK